MEIQSIQDALLPECREPISLLYVDDEPGLLEICRFFLEQTREFMVDTSESALDALERLTCRHYDIIISDYQMPRMDGLEFLREVRKTNPDLPFIIFTGRGREEVAISALNAGATFYLQKGGDVESQFAELANEIRLAVSKRHSEKELIESERRYRDVVDMQTDFIVRFAPDLRIVFANNAYCRYFSLDKSACIGSKFRPVVPVKEQCDVKEHFAGLTPEKPSGTIVHRILLPEGETRWHQWTTTAIYDPGGNLTEYQSVGQDITEIKHAENLWHTVIDFGSSATIIVEYTGIISYANQAYADLAGYHRIQEVLGRKLADFIMPADLSRMEKYHILRHINPTFVPHRYQFLFLQKSGASRTVTVTAGVIPDTKKTVLSIIDVTGLVEARLKLKQNESFYRFIIDNIQDGYYCVDSSGLIVRISPALAARFGFEQSEILGKNIASLLLDPVDREGILTRIKEQGNVTGYKVSVRKKDATRVMISITGHALSDDDGNTIGIEGIVVDAGQ